MTPVVDSTLSTMTNNGSLPIDANNTTATSSSRISELSPSDLFRIICFWILFLIGVVGNLLVLVVIVWKRNRKQASFLFNYVFKIC
jgi:hypothetical protein